MRDNLSRVSDYIWDTELLEEAEIKGFYQSVEAEEYEAAFKIAVNLAGRGKKDYLLKLWQVVHQNKPGLGLKIVEQFAFIAKQAKTPVETIIPEVEKLCVLEEISSPEIQEIITDLKFCIRDLFL